MSKIDHFLKESFIYSLTKIIPGLFGFVSIIIFIRFLGTEEYGYFSILFLLIQISSCFMMAFTVLAWICDLMLELWGVVIVDQ